MSDIDRIAERLFTALFWASDGTTVGKRECIRDCLLEYGAIVREECAKVVEDGVKWEPNFPPNVQRVTDETCFLLAKAIRNANKG